MKKTAGIFMFAVLSMLMGGAAGAVIWLILKVMNAGIEVIWTRIPESLGLSGTLVYSLAVCTAGGILIGLGQRRFGALPENLHQVMGKVKADGGYPYDRLHIIALTALLPLVFGGAVGPEAGLSGFIAGICTLIGDRLKYKGDRVAAMAETGIAAAVGVIFGSPLFGIVGNLEPDDRSEKYREKLVSKKSRILIYCAGVAGGMLAMKGLSTVFGSSGSLPRFAREHAVGFDQWKWSILLIAAGILAGVVFLLFQKLTACAGRLMQNRKIVSAAAAGVLLGVIGHFIPESMFSGEHQMAELIEKWTEYSAWILILAAAAKMLLVNVCINFGWRGGNIFPMIYAGVAVGYAFALATGMENAASVLDGGFAVAMTVSAMCGYIMRKPLMVVAVLLLCFPVTYIIPIAAAAFVASRVPEIPLLKEE